jgi:LCP family protein required for cell wall assembly
VAIATSAIVLGTATAGYAYYQRLNGNITKDALNLGDGKAAKSKANAAGQTPLNILVLGSDSRNGAANVKLGGAKDQAGRGALADVEMLMHVSADRSNMTVMSIPRDTRVRIPKCTGPDGTVYPETTTQTINASLSHGGPGCTVATWENLTGISIDHFMMVDFAGVVSMADSIGGVPVCVGSNVHDPQSGLRLTKGTHTVTGLQALQWLRTRHAFEDGSDIGRTHAQHMYLNSMIRQLKSGTQLSDPAKLLGLAATATKSLTVDTGLGSVDKLVGLTGDVNQVPTDRINMTTMPWGADPQDPSAHVVPTSAASTLFTMIRNDQAVDGKTSTKKSGSSSTSSAPSTAGNTAKASPKADIGVSVYNGTGSSTTAAISGRARAIAQHLKTLGYTKAAADSTAKSQSGTTISYPSDAEKAGAQAVAKSLNLPSSAVSKSTAVSAISLVIGSDWTTGTSYPMTSKTEAKAALSQAAALNASNNSACMTVYAAYSF